jgi:hypothetical protein
MSVMTMPFVQARNFTRGLSNYIDVDPDGAAPSAGK